jgi:hypothetical protein
MLPEQIKMFRDIVTLKDGVSVLLRPMTTEDKQRLVDLFAPISDEDLRYLRNNVRDSALVESWFEHLDYNRVLPLIALVKDQVVGQATLHFRSGPHLPDKKFPAARSGDTHAEYLNRPRPPPGPGQFAG